MSKIIRLLVVISMATQQLLVLVPPAGAAAQLLDQTERDTIADFVRRLDDLAYFEALGEPIPFTAVTPSNEQALRFGSLFEPLAGKIENGLLNDTYDDHGVGVVFDIVEDGLNASLVMAATRETTLPITLSIEDPTSDTPGLCNDGIDNGGDGDADQDDSDCTYIGFYLNGGGVKTKLQFDAEFHFEKADDASLYYLSQPPTMTLAINNLEAEIVSFTDQLGFTDVEVSSSTSSLNEQIVLQFVDPDGDGRITKDEWTFTAIEDLTEVSFGEGSTVNMLLTPDSNLVDPDGSISLAIDLSQDQDWPAATQVNLHENLRKFANIGPDAMLAGLASYAVGLNTALLSGEIQLPFLEAHFSDVFLPGKPILELVRQQTDALVICGQTDTLPPTGDPTNAATIYCQAITYADPAEVKSWTLEGATLEYSGLLTETVGVSPQKNAKFNRQNTSERPRARVEFVDPDGQTHTVFPRVLSAQQLETELNKKIEELTGGGAVLSYNSEQLALMYDITMTMSPPMTTTQFSFADRLRQATNLANLKPATNTKPEVEFQNVVINSTVGAILVDDVAQLAPGSEGGPCDDGEDNDEDGLIDEYDPDCPMSNGPGDRFFIGVNPDPAAYEIEVGDLSLTNAGQVDLEGNIGFLDVTAGGPFTIQKGEGADPVLGVDILAPEGFTVHSTPPFQIDNAIRTREFLADSGLYDPGENKGHVNHNINMETSAGLTVQSSPDSLSEVLTGNVDIEWDLANSDSPTITPDPDFSTRLRPFDIAPTLAGVHTSSDTTEALIDTSRNFLEDFGGGLQAGDVLNLELFNLTDGSSCNGFIVEPNTLTCISGYNPDGTPVPGMLAGGVDNFWHPGDEYEIPGDPQALGSLILDSFYNLASQMKGLDLDNPAKAEFASTLPLIGLSPRNLATQLDGVAAAVVKTRSSAEDAQIICQPDIEASGVDANLFCQAFTDVPSITAAQWSLSEGHGDFTAVYTTTAAISDTVGSSPTAYAAFSITVPKEEGDQFRVSLVFTDTDQIAYRATFPPRSINNLSDLNAKIKELLEREFNPGNVTVTFSMDDLQNPANNGPPVQHLVPHLEIHDAGQKDYRLRLDFSDFELTATDPFSTALSLGYSSQAQFDLGIPLATIISAYDVVVRDTTGLALTMNVADSPVDIEANLGGMAVKVGESAFLTGTHTLERITGTHDSPVSSTTTLTANQNIEALGVVTGTETILTKTGTSSSCTVAAIDGNMVTCENPLGGGGDQWDQGDGFELVGPNTKRLHHPGLNFEDLNIQPGSRVTNITKSAYCQVTEVLTDVLSCEDGLSDDSAWSEGDEYEVSGEGTISMELTSSLKVTRTLPITGFVGGLEHTFSSPRQDVISATLAIAQKEGGLIQVVEVAYGIDDIPDGIPAGDFSRLLAAAEGTPIDWSLLPAPLVLLDDTIRQNLDGRWWNFGLPLVGYDLGAGAEITVKDKLTDNKLAVNDALNQAFFDEICDVTSDTAVFIIETNGDNPTHTCSNLPDDPIDADNVKSLEIKFTLHENSTKLVTFGMGLPGLPLEPGNNEQQVQSTVGWVLTATFGLSRTIGPYLKVGDSDELLIGADVTLQEIDSSKCTKDVPPLLNDEHGLDFENTRCLDAVLGFLPGTVFDGNRDSDGDDQKSNLQLLTTLDLGNGSSDILTYGQLLDGTGAHTVNVDADAHVDLAFEADFDESVEILPIIGTFHLSFDTGGSQNVVDGIQAGWVTEEPGYKHVYMNAASFFGGFVGPIVEDAQSFTKPFQPPIDTLNAPVPVISDLSQALGQGPMSMFTLLEAVSGNDLTLIKRLAGFITFVNNLPADDYGLWIGLGGDNNGDDSPGMFSLNVEETLEPPCYEDEVEDWLEGKVEGCSPDNSIEKNWEKIDQTKTKSGREVTKKRFAEAKAEWEKGGISLPFLNDTKQIYGMLLGIDATLLRVDFGTVTGQAGISYSYYTVFVTAVGPIPVEFIVGANVSVSGRFAMGYDTRGLRHALSGESFTGEALLDGIFLDDYDASGNEVPELSFVAEFYAGAAVSIRIIKVGLELGVSFTVDLDLNDPNSDGKMYIDEIMMWRFNPVCLFEFSGSLGFFLRFFVEVDLFFFTARAEWYPFKANINLFNVKCEPPKPVLGKGNGEFWLSIGTKASDRNIYTDVTNEKITVRQLTWVGAGCSTLGFTHELEQQSGPFKAGPATDCEVEDRAQYSGTWISVVFQGIKQTFFLPGTNVDDTASIYAKADTGDDVIRLLPGSDKEKKEIPFQLEAVIDGGTGNDRITTGYGDDEVYGDEGNDVMNTSRGNDTVRGGSGNDSIDAGIGHDILYGDEDDDILNGGPGIDAVDGGSGNDRLTGGPGLSSGYEEALQDKNDVLVGGSGDDELEGDYGDNYLFGDDLQGYDGSIEEFHEDLKSVDSGTLPSNFNRETACEQNQQNGGGQDALTGGNGADHLFGGPRNDSLAGGKGNDYLCGNAGHDILDGSQGDDALHGGSGNDQLRGWSGHDLLVGGTDNDLLRGGADHDDLIGDFLLQNGETFQELNDESGSDALVGEIGNDILIGDTGRITPADHPSALHTAVLTDVLKSITLEDYGNSGTVSCTLRVQVVNGLVDVNGDGQVNGHDNGFFEGFPVAAGLVNYDMDDTGTITGMDTGFINEILIQEGLVDVNGDGEANDNDDGTVLGLAIAGSGHADCLFGGDDSDYLFGGPGNDQMFGDAGTDYLEGNGGSDTMRGGQEDDRMYGDNTCTGLGPSAQCIPPNDPGGDSMFGDSGDDYMEGNEDRDTMRGGMGADRMLGGSSAEQTPDAGDDMYGDAETDIMLGDNGMISEDGRLIETIDPAIGDDDTILGNDGDDLILGGAADDDIWGNPGADILLGDNGRITRNAAEVVEQFESTYPNQGGVDTISGGIGADLVFGGTISDTISGDEGHDILLGDHGLFDDSLPPNQNFVAIFTGPEDGGAGDNIHGNDGEDIILGQQGIDHLYGDAGQDDLTGGHNVPGGADDEDMMYGESDESPGTPDGSGADVMIGDNGVISRTLTTTGTWQVNPSNQTYARVVQLYDVEMVGEPQIEPGVYGDDKMWGNSNDDIMYGQGGQDIMHGGAGDDYMEGNAASDLMYGEGEDDDMVGGTGPTTSNDLDTALPGRVDASTITRTTVVSDEISVSLGDEMYGGAGADVMLGDNGIITRADDTWEILDYTLLADSFGDEAPRHFLSTTPGSRVDRQVQMIDTEPGKTGGSDLMFGGPGEDDMYGQFDDTDFKYPDSANYEKKQYLADLGIDTTIGDELYGEEGEDAMLGDNGVIDNRALSDPTQEIAPHEPFFEDERFVQGSLIRDVTLDFVNQGGEDRMLGGPNGDWMHGGAGNDLMSGNPGNDRLFGDDGEDVLWGGFDHDHLYGGYGNDYLDVKPRPEMTVGKKNKPMTLPPDLIEWFAFGENARHQDNYEGVDYIYGGWGQDAMQADQADHGPVPGDRLIDWVGAYNVYYLCPALYGEFVITRDHSPAIIEFLQQLAEGDGASEPANSGSSGFNEVAMVFPKDARYNSHPVHPDNPAHFTCEQSVPPDLSIKKTDDQTVVTPGQVLTYTLTFSNFGTLDATGVVISDTLPADTTFLAASHSGSYAEGVVTWPTVTLTVGASLSRTLTVQLDKPLPTGIEVITNTASVADDGSHGSDLWPEDNTASDVDRVTPLPDLTIAMVEGRSVVTSGQILTYTITISNAGNVDVTGVMISNTQGVHSSFVAASHSGSYTASVVTWPAIALTVGSSVSRTFTVQVDERLPAGVDAITQTAAVADDGANGPDPNLTNNKVLVSVPVEAAPDLSLAKQANSLFAVPGQPLTYTLVYSNSGSQGATGLVISETVPAGTTFNAAASSSGWNCNPAGSDCVLVVSDLAAGDGGVATFAVTVTALPPAEMAIITNTAVLTDDGQNGPDPTPANNQATDVTPVNFVPAAADDRVTVDEDSADNLLDVLANDVDLGDEPLTITLVGTASHGTVVNDLTALRYTPLPDFFGSDQFAYTVSDGILSDTARVTVTVAPLNDPPLAVVDTVTLPEDSPMSPLAVLANDTDVDGDSLTITLVSAATHGTVIHTGAELLYAPTADFYGRDRFTYTVSDGLLTDTAGVTVVIAPVNDPPIAVGDDVTVDEDSLNNVLDVLANDTDVDSELLTITRVSTTTHGTLVNHGVEVSYTPEADFFGTDHVTYTVSDGVLTGTALVTLSVLPINDPPVAVDDDVRVIMNSTINRLNVTDNDVDPDGDLLTITLASTASHGTVIRNATSLLYTPTPNFTGTDYLTYTVSDGVLSDTGMITVTISELDNTIYLPVIIKND